MHRPKLIAVALAAALFSVVACTDEEATTTTSAPESTGTTAFPVTIGEGDDAVTISEKPERIVSLSPTATEMLFAIGAGDQVVAVDDQSNYPADAPMTDLSGFTPNAESVLSYEPDLVVVAFDDGVIVDALADAEVPTLVQPPATALADTYEQITDLGLATGNVDGATETNDAIVDGIDRIVTELDPDINVAEATTYYHELDDTYFTVTSSTFVGELYGLVGLTSIADAADADGAAGGYPQLSAEFIVQEDPDFVFLADTKCCGQTAETFASRPGMSGLTAVTTDRVIELDDDVASRWGPRVVEFLDVVADAVAA